MTIRIAVAGLKVGMYIDSMEGAWMDNPFWRRSLLLTSEDDIARLQASSIAYVSIDPHKGGGTTMRPAAERRCGAMQCAATAMLKATPAPAPMGHAR